MHSHTYHDLLSPDGRLAMPSVARCEYPMGTSRDIDIPNRLQCTMKRLREVYDMINPGVEQISVNGMVGCRHGSGERYGRISTWFR